MTGKPCKCQDIGMHELHRSQEETVRDFLRDKKDVETHGRTLSFARSAAVLFSLSSMCLLHCKLV